MLCKLDPTVLEDHIEHPALRISQDVESHGQGNGIAGVLPRQLKACLRNGLVPNRMSFNNDVFLRPLEKANKSSIVFHVAHEEGSLSKVLTILSFYGINLTKIQSLPVIGCEWEYLFYVDLTFENLTRYRQSIDAIIPLTRSLRILGEYEAC